jgi:hypothetical protein
MAVYNCECGLIISTSSDRPRCLRCLRILGPQDVAHGADPLRFSAGDRASGVIEQRMQLRKVTMGFRLNERPVLWPVVRLK